MGNKRPECKKKSFIEILVPVLTLLTIANCAVILVLVMNIGRKVNRLEQQVLLIQNETKNALVTEQEVVLADISDLDGNAVDAEEAADIAAVEVQENTHKWDGKGDSSNGIRRVYLTFDDGPSANTDRILDILAQYGVKATFFVVGKEGYTDQYRRIVEDGHTLAMHSYSHRYNEVYASLDSYKADLTKLHDYLYELTGEDCRFVRFPGGSSNTVSKVSMWDLIDSSRVRIWYILTGMCQAEIPQVVKKVWTSSRTMYLRISESTIMPLCFFMTQQERQLQWTRWQGL